MPKLLKRNGLLLVAAWSIGVLAMMGVANYAHQKYVIQQALQEARGHSQITLLYRTWISAIGGIYARADRIPPDPRFQDRDKIARDGTRLTLVNPAYMTRLVYQTMKHDSGLPVNSRLVSLKPMNPANAGDDWEREALKEFERGKCVEKVQQVTLNGHPYLRLISRHIAEAACLDCHGRQGYKQGDVRGGITISIPLRSSIIPDPRTNGMMYGGFFILWISGNIGIVGLARRSFKQNKVLRESEERFRMLLESSENIAVQGFRKDGTITYWNKGSEEVYGYTVEEAVGRNLFDLIIPEEMHKEGHEAVRMMYETGTPMAASELSMIHRDGSRVPVFTSHAVVQPFGKEKEFFCMDIDLRDLKKAEEALHRSEERLRLTYEAAPVGIAEVDLEGRIISVNGAICEITGLSRTDFLTMSIDRLIPSAGDVGFKQLAPSSSLETFFTHADGSIVWAEVRMVFARDETGTPVYSICTVENITARKQAREELEQANDELERRVTERTNDLARTIDQLRQEIQERENAEEALHAETLRRVEAMEEVRKKDQLLMLQSRHAAMGEMISNIAHQWRQPLNTLGLIVQDLQMQHELGGMSDVYMNEMAGKAMQTIFHMSRTIDNFRDFLRPNKEAVTFDIGKQLAATLSLLEVALKHQGIEVVFQCAAGIDAWGFPNEFTQVIVNILNNARDAFTERRVEHPVITADIRQCTGKAVITITDNAGGVPEEIVDRIFDPYFTTKGPEKGTGLGLFMSKTIIEKNMKGRLEVRNLEGGAEFSIEIPGHFT